MGLGATAMFGLKQLKGLGYLNPEGHVFLAAKVNLDRRRYESPL